MLSKQVYEISGKRERTFCQSAPASMSDDLDISLDDAYNLRNVRNHCEVDGRVVKSENQFIFTKTYLLQQFPDKKIEIFVRRNTKHHTRPRSNCIIGMSRPLTSIQDQVYGCRSSLLFFTVLLACLLFLGALTPAVM